MKNIKSYFIKIVYFLLAFVLVFSTACSNLNEKDDSDVKSITYSESKEYKGGLHSFNKSELGGYIVQNGNSGYEIVIPDSPDRTTITAAAELQSLVDEATGAWLNIKNESVRDTSLNYISLGNTALSQTANVSIAGYNLNSQGYVIKTVSGNVYIKAGGEHGVLWGVYEFLTQTLGYTCVSYDTWDFLSESKNIKLYDFDIVDNPDFEIRISGNGVIDGVEEYGHKYRWVQRMRDVYLSSVPYHNFFYFIPKEDYEKDHPKWYSDDGVQLCLTAHGDAEEYEGLVSTMVERVKKEIMLDDNKQIITITQEDYFTWCNCDTCKGLNEKYGTDAGSDILFINDVAERIEEWLNVYQPGRKVLITVFAYMRTLNPPVIKNSDGTYSPVDSDVICRDNVAVIYAPVYEPLTYSADQKENVAIQETINGWAAVCKNFGYWWYHIYYTHYQIMFNNVGAIQSTYRYLLNNSNPTWIFDQGQTDDANISGFVLFKMYLESQWQWDVNRDYNTLKKTFFDLYFKDASGIMEKFFDEYSTKLFQIISETGNGSSAFSNLLKTSNFPIRLLEQWLEYIDDAYKAIEKYKDTDTVLYNKLYDHINLESIGIRYALLTLYSGNFTNTELEEMQTALDNDCLRLGINYFLAT